MEIEYKAGKKDVFMVKSPVDSVYNIDPFGQASAGLREIFNSHDPVLISAIQANIKAFQTAARREKQAAQQGEEIKYLKEKCEKLEERVASLEAEAATAASKKSEAK